MTLMMCCIAATLVSLAVAHRMCTTCIPLKDLVADGYGISISLDSLTSAAAHHNGTATILSSVSAGTEYRALMSTILTRHYTEQPRYTVMRCPARHRWQSDQTEHAKAFWTYALDWLRMSLSPSTVIPIETGPRLGPIAQMFQAQLLALEPFTGNNAQRLADVAVAIQIPAWLISSPYACDLREAAEATFGRVFGLESPSSSAYTSLGYELCRVAQEAYDCTGPGRLAVLEYDGHFATASVIRTPVDCLDHLNSEYSLLESTDSVELSDWMNSFINTTTPDMITLAGPQAEQSSFQRALVSSNAIERIQLLPAAKIDDILVLGAAQVAKDYLETHDSDCTEFDECFSIREEADKLAGRYAHPRPQKWPADNSRHWREWERRTTEIVFIPEMRPPLFDQEGHVVGFL